MAENNNNGIPEISVVIPVYNEEGSIEGVVREVVASLDAAGLDFEVIVVDDGSTDKSWEAMGRAATADRRVRLIRLRRNFGQTAAMRAGFDYSRSEVIVSLDGDGQNDPADIPGLVKKLREGFDVVSGWRRRRRDFWLTRRLPSIMGNLLISLLTGVKLHDFGCTLKAYRREVIEELSLYGEMHRMIPVLAHLMGASIIEVEVNHRPRSAGASKYNLLRAVSVILDLITLKFFLGYFTRPLHFFGLVGLVSIIAGGASFVAVVFMKYAQGFNMTGNPFLNLGVMCTVVGFQLVMLGLLGEVTIRTYFESQKKPIYMVREIREHDENP